ncbi:MAG: N-acetylmuramic acid 6-phosphate etherase [Deinococcota bacterium]
MTTQRMNTELTGGDYAALDTWSLAESLQALVSSQKRAAACVEAALPALEQAATGIERCLAAGGRLIYIGAGTSGRLALQDAAELVPTFSFNNTVVLMAGGTAASERPIEYAEDNQDQARAEVDALKLSKQDAVIAIAASGRTPYTLAGLQAAKAASAFTVGLASNAGTPILDAADVGVFLDSGPEVLAGSTRLAAGTAQKIALNMLSTAVLVRLGGAFGNVMVGMRPTNTKLEQRAVRIVQEAAASEGLDLSTERAEASLKAANWHIREAIVMALTALDYAAAQQLLHNHHQRVRDTLTTFRQSVDD